MAGDYAREPMKHGVFMRSILLLVLITMTFIPVAVTAEDGPWVVTTDYGVFGRIESFSPEAPWNISFELGITPGDAVGRYFDGLVYIVGRGGSNLIQVYNPDENFELVREFSIGAGRNPQDIAFDDQGRAFVSCYDEAVLLQVDVEAGVVVQTFDTSSFADSDGLPETAWLMIHQNRLYITCQLLDRGNWYSPTGPGKLLVMDLNSMQWLNPVSLSGANPYTKIRLGDNGKLLVGCVGFWALLDAGIEIINPDSGLSEGYLVTEEELGGDVVNFVTAGTSQLFVLISNTSFVTSIVSVDLNNGGVASIVTSSGYDLADLAWDGDFQLYVADRVVGAAGIRVFDSLSGVELTNGAVITTLPPFQFVLPTGSDLSETPEVGMHVGSLNLGLPFPNPCNPAADLIIEDDPNSSVAVSVFDLRGRRVQESTLITDSSGRASFRFNGLDANGSALSAGLYRVVAQSRRGFAARSLTLVK